ncbi:isocitrate/isopropylmalate family dehydrogenase [Salinisphaera sp. P385]|uniref:Isocitrate/isopropylmalate family dehydrogenase n=1 Tax=Spectribacter acetivorans TaxID=3075603 RepID=A0ABU3B5E8_9GAMM|nr:isocitrate/isopropylmalate family dehydrogenase [Salinisphaera sp. P385]MDT0617679.1 isocitrate/isopropylmalate family dehydrogenase [Salinisphaera sp. P385]
MQARQQWRVAVLPGDGIGPEVMAQTERVLSALADREGLDLTATRFGWPSHAWHQQHGEIAPADYLQTLAGFDAILLGALGDPGPTSNPDRYLLSDADSLAPLLDIRKHFDQWACERPCRPLPGAPCYLADARAADIDMLVIRENSEGEYVGQGGRLAPGTEREIVTQTGVFTRRGTARIIRHAFEQARLRAEQRRRDSRARHFDGCESQVCLVTKRNALKFWGEMYTEVFAEVSADYPDVATHHELVDAACMKFVTRPWDFDVVVASNLHGDILTDLAAVLNGGMGVAPSCNLNPADRHCPPMFEPTHGSAPDIAGQDIAGPTAMLLTAAMMLDWMGEEDPAARRAAGRLRTVVSADLAAHGGDDRGTTAVGEAVLARLRDEPAGA